MPFALLSVDDDDRNLRRLRDSGDVPDELAAENLAPRLVPVPHARIAAEQFGSRP